MTAAGPRGAGRGGRGAEAAAAAAGEIITYFKIATALEYSVAESLIQEAINIDIQSIIHRITNV